MIVISLYFSLRNILTKCYFIRHAHSLFRTSCSLSISLLTSYPELFFIPRKKNLEKFADIVSTPKVVPGIVSYRTMMTDDLINDHLFTDSTLIPVIMITWRKYSTWAY